MAPQEIAALTAQVNDLDRETVRRVARLVVECRASLPLALLAVQHANTVGVHVQPERHPRRALTRFLAYLGAC